MEKYDKNSATTYALGTTLSIELLKRRIDLAKRIYISPKQRRDDTYSLILSLAKEKNIPIIENNEKIFRALSEKDNCMVIAEFKKEEAPLDKERNHIVLVNPSNKGNLGTIFRSAAAFGYKDIAIITPAADYFDPKAIRSSMGAIFSLNVFRFPSFDEYLSLYKERHLYPFLLKAENTLNEVRKESPYSLIFGNEATGLPDVFYSLGTPTKIPQSSLVDSLNLDNAVSIALYAFSEIK